MSQDLGLRFILRNRGAYTDFLPRYRLEAAAALAEGGDRVLEFFDGLILATSDERNLRIAADHIRQYGGSAPGCDGVCLQNLARMYHWEIARRLRDLIRAGEYQRGPLRRCRIPKRPWSTERRTIYLANLSDRIVMRATAQTLQPILAPVIDPMSYCWPCRGVQEALAHAQYLVTSEDRTLWIVEDIQSAFDCVPRERLAQILRRQVPNDEFCRIVTDLVTPPTRHGILQGSSLSPMLLDVYLSYLLHQPWRRDGSLPPLLRYVDDVLIPCRRADDAERHYERLASLLQSAGFQAKHGFEKAAVDLRHDPATWLGYRLRVVRNQLEIRSKHFDDRFAESESEGRSLLLDKFVRLHERSDAWLRVDGVIQGLIAHLAPTLPFVDATAIYQQIRTVAREAGFAEIRSRDDMLLHWQTAHSKWLERCERVRIAR